MNDDLLDVRVLSDPLSLRLLTGELPSSPFSAIEVHSRSFISSTPEKLSAEDLLVNPNFNGLKRVDSLILDRPDADEEAESGREASISIPLKLVASLGALWSSSFSLFEKERWKFKWPLNNGKKQCASPLSPE
ncbi:hypothetical protein BABINDRAFT_162000 [Babjeviella inositovora NRRL Y-12698]|uniref:Uncharacterized protein n=1 Tax=Babjeviella inositovora NRRL Y-12698 TaxID=984486 RepID=A0A1E3QPI3_9ASCO|nr:uncharacterized protein BABINDRAFT_162000 [Babjeviella inositovora NRRL Y-12698]ODQ79619.1 hypothetical protein BABINDRAFT_162000 [Babjeviella inositovora NRRL Y-12698]